MRLIHKAALQALLLRSVPMPAYRVSALPDLHVLIEIWLDKTMAACFCKLQRAWHLRAICLFTAADTVVRQIPSTFAAFNAFRLFL